MRGEGGNPYPGARPLDPSDSAVLLGRDSLLEKFANAVRNHVVVEVTGPSGVGKSSLIGAGFVGRLNVESGLIIRMFAEWSTVPEATGTAWYAQALHLALRNRNERGQGGADPAVQARVDDVLAALPMPSADPSGFVRAIQRELGSELIVVFDQLEELLRDDPTLGRKFLMNVREVASLYEGGFTQVVSLREEYESHLRLIEESLDGALWRIIRVGEVSSEFIPHMISVPLKVARTGVDADRSLVDHLTGAWLAARPEATADARWRSFDEAQTGLLHLQAFLYTMWDTIRPSAGDVLTADAVASALALKWPSTQAEAHAFFAEGLKRYVRLEIDKRAKEFLRAEAGVAGDNDLGRRIVNETKRIAAMLPEHLSSAGYKLARGTDELAATVLTAMSELHRPLTREEIGDGTRTPVTHDQGNDRNQQVQPIAAALAKLCRTDHPEDAVSLFEAAKRVYPGLETWGDDRAPAGRMKGKTALRTASELVVTYERALRWLTDSSIIRMTQTRKGERIAAIVHDGFGDALRAWAADAIDDPEVETSIPVAVTGKQVLFRETGDSDALTPENLRNIDGLAWIGCNVKAFFDGLTFRNCDFRSTLFKDCRFRNVVFEDCIVDGLLFQDTVFEGGFTMRACEGGERVFIKTVTFGRGCRASGGPIVARSLSGYGLFLDGIAGPWRIDDCDLSHVFITGTPDGEGAGPGVIVDSPGLKHVVITGKTTGGIAIVRSVEPQFFERDRIGLTFPDEDVP